MRPMRLHLCNECIENLKLSGFSLHPAKDTMTDKCENCGKKIKCDRYLVTKEKK